MGDFDRGISCVEDGISFEGKKRELVRVCAEGPVGGAVVDEAAVVGRPTSGCEAILSASRSSAEASRCDWIYVPTELRFPSAFRSTGRQVSVKTGPEALSPSASLCFNLSTRIRSSSAWAS